MKRLLTALLFLSLSSCERNSPCTLEEEQIVRVFTDMQLAEVAAQNLTGAVKDSVLKAYYEQIFVIHGLEKERFEVCFDALQKEPEQLGLILEKVLEELNRQRAQVQVDSTGLQAPD